MKKQAFVDNAANPKQVEEAKKKEHNLSSQELEDLRVVLSTVEGRRYMLGLLQRCRIYKESFTGNSHTFYNEGKRNIGLKLFGDLHKGALDLYQIMINEGFKNGFDIGQGG